VADADRRVLDPAPGVALWERVEALTGVALGAPAAAPGPRERAHPAA
jgi:hypothetical protein